MSKHLYDLPPLSALVSFESAARHASFKKAATELNVTPAAVSHQVKALENELQRHLFRRHHRGVELNETGAYLLVALQKGFEGISEAIEHLRLRGNQPSVTIRATTAVSALWLTPKLARFWKIHGHISVSQNVSDVEMDAADSELSVHYGDISKETGGCRVLFSDTIVALGSPRFAERYEIQHPSDFGQIPLVHLEARETGWTDWREWCCAVGYTGPLGRGFHVNNYMIALQAARDDMGAVLGWSGLVTALLEAGHLVKLTSDVMVSPLDFYIKVHPYASEHARLLSDWLTDPSNA